MSRLLFFPTPYPGESMYSIMARIHQRSGNSLSGQTKEELLGSSYVSCHQYIVAPVHRDYIAQWFPDNSDLEALYKEFRNSHSAAPLTFLRPSWCLAPEAGRGFLYKNTACARRAWSASIFKEFGSGSEARLRYCPFCAAQQISVYGECYWEVLPQVFHMHYCPIHETLYLKSRLTTRDAKKNLIPLSEVISPSEDAPVSLHGRKYEDMELQYSKNIKWLWDNSTLFNCTTSSKIRTFIINNYNYNNVYIDDMIQYILQQSMPKCRVRVDTYFYFTYYLNIYQILCILETYFFPVKELAEKLNNY